MSSRGIGRGRVARGAARGKPVVMRGRGRGRGAAKPVRKITALRRENTDLPEEAEMENQSKVAEPVKMISFEITALSHHQYLYSLRLCYWMTSISSE
jgi:hypothetical protein